jgi:hypothetical protein
MDPEATYRDLLEAIAEGDMEGAANHASDLAQWLRRGGFAPVVDQRLVGFPHLQRVLAVSLCKAVLDPSFSSLLNRS